MSGEESDGFVASTNEEKKIKKRGRAKKPAPNAHYDEYSGSDIFEFIKMVESCSLIWDSTSKSYHRNEARKEAFDNIESEMSSFMAREKVHGRTAENLWNLLKKDYQKERKRLENLPSGSGKSQNTFQFYKAMAFLDQDRANRAVKNVFVIGPEETNTDDDDEEKLSGKRTKDLVKTPKRKKIDNRLESVINGFEKTNETFMKAIQDLAANEKEVEVKPCPYERICTFVKNVLDPMDTIEKIQKEAEIITFLAKISKTPEPSHTIVPQVDPSIGFGFFNDNFH